MLALHAARITLLVAILLTIAGIATHQLVRLAIPALALALAVRSCLVPALEAHQYAALKTPQREPLPRPLAGACTCAYLGAAIPAYVLLLASWSRLGAVGPCEASRTAFEALNRDDASKHKLLPRIIHRQWKDERHPDDNITFFYARWKEVFPEPKWRFMLWTDDNARTLIAANYSWFLPYYDSYGTNIQRADVARLFILLQYGGLYADADYEPMTNFWHYLPADRLALVESPYKYNEEVQNSLMSSPAEAPLLRYATHLLASTHNLSVLSSTGPAFLQHVLKRAALSGEPLHELPCENFQRGRFFIGWEGVISGMWSRNAMALLYPMKWCGSYAANDECHFARHHNAATWVASARGFGLL